MALFYPTMYRRRITDISVADLANMGVSAVLLDVDNTLTTHDNPHITEAVNAWLCNMRAAGMRLIIVSNNSDERVAPFAQALEMPYTAHACKPLPKGYREAAAAVGMPLSACVAIGDQIFTDILGANLSGIKSILLEPIEPEIEQKFIVFKRKIERILLANKRQRRRKDADYEY